MTNKKSTKRSLLASLISLVVCIAMLIGSTYAWFTDSVTSGGNKIVSGKLDVDLYMWTASDVSTEITDTSDPIFGEGSLAQNNNAETLWEPGKTQVAYLSIKNNGNLDLKYMVNVDVNAENSALYEVMEYDIVPDAKFGEVTDWNGGIKVDTGINTTEANEVALKAGEEHFFALSVHMNEDAGNKYQNGKVNFDIRVLATQLASEEDSFDNQYDKDAPMVWTGKTDTDWYLDNPTTAEFELSTAEELAGLAAIVNGTAEGVDQDTFSGQTIKLSSDIDLGNISWDTIGRNHDDEGSDPFNGTFDGQGHTVYNLNIQIEDNKRDSVGFIGCAKNATIKNLNIENVYIDADYFVGAVVGKITSGEISNCHVKGDINVSSRRNYAAGIVGDGYYNMENCSVIADGMGNIKSSAVAGGLCGRINEGAHYIKNCTVKNLNIQSGQQIAAISGFVHYGNTISGCNVENVNLTLTATNVMAPAIGLASGLWYYKNSAPITMSDNTFKNITVSAINNVTGTANILHGWEWNDRLTGVVESNNTMENVTNNLNYQ